MKSKFILFSSLLSLLSTTTFNCDPACDVLFKIVNKSDYDLQVCADRIGQEYDTTLLQKDSTYILHEKHGICQASTYRDRFSQLFDTIIIMRNDSIVYSQIPADLSKWQIIKEDIENNGEGVGYYQLIITNDSLIN